MDVQTQIGDYLAAQPERKRNDMQTLHGMMLSVMPDCRVWFLDGKDEDGRTVSNPSIGYGLLPTGPAPAELRWLHEHPCVRVQHDIRRRTVRTTGARSRGRSFLRSPARRRRRTLRSTRGPLAHRASVVLARIGAFKMPGCR